MDIQIPLYRAKKLESDEYVCGDYCSKTNRIYTNELMMTYHTQNEFGNFHFYCHNYYQIDPSTLAIHFLDMLDSEGNKIFASLSEDGKGGDKLKIVALTNDHCQKGTISELTAFVQMGRVCVGAGVPIYPLNLTHSFQTIGIQK